MFKGLRVKRLPRATRQHKMDLYMKQPGSNVSSCPNLKLNMPEDLDLKADPRRPNLRPVCHDQESTP